MSSDVVNFLDDLLADPLLPSWHEAERRDLGIPEDCAQEALLCLSLQIPGKSERPLAFVVEQRDLKNTLTAVGEFLHETFHPAYGFGQCLAVIDFLPPMDGHGTARGVARRWVLDASNHEPVFEVVRAHLQRMAVGL